MAQNKFSGIAKRKKPLLAAAAIAVVATSSFIFIQNKNELSQNTTLSFSDLSEHQDIDVLLQTRTGTLSLSRDDDAFLQPDSPFSPPYKLSAALKTPEQQYRDILFSVDRERKTLTVLADGFSPDDKITMRMNDEIVFDAIPMDWSGRIELKVAIANPKPVTTCLEIESNISSFGTCHAVPEGRKT